MIEINNQFFVVLQSFIFGFFLEMLYEIHSSAGFLFGMRGTRVKLNKVNFQYIYKNSKIKKALLILWDFVYFLQISPISAIFLYAINNGIVRWYIILASLLGFVIFKISIGRLLSYILDLLVLLLKAYIINKVAFLIKKAIRLVKRPIKKTKKNEKSKRTVLLSINQKQG